MQQEDEADDYSLDLPTPREIKPAQATQRSAIRVKELDLEVVFR
jgi:hypothetical protein